MVLRRDRRQPRRRVPHDRQQAVEEQRDDRRGRAGAERVPAQIRHRRDQQHQQRQRGNRLHDADGAQNDAPQPRPLRRQHAQRHGDENRGNERAAHQVADAPACAAKSATRRIRPSTSDGRSTTCRCRNFGRRLRLRSPSPDSTSALSSIIVRCVDLRRRAWRSASPPLGNAPPGRPATAARRRSCGK